MNEITEIHETNTLQEKEPMTTKTISRHFIKWFGAVVIGMAAIPGPSIANEGDVSTHQAPELRRYLHRRSRVSRPRLLWASLDQDAPAQPDGAGGAAADQLLRAVRLRSFACGAFHGLLSHESGIPKIRVPRTRQREDVFPSEILAVEPRRDYDCRNSQVVRISDRLHRQMGRLGAFAAQ